MFVAACLDAQPELWPEVVAAVAALDLGAAAHCRLLAHSDGVLTGRRFLVAAEASSAASRDGGHHHPHGVGAHHHGTAHDHHGHAEDHGTHRAWADIRALLTGAPLGQAVVAHAVGIFMLLADAEAEVHGVSPDRVAFHEVGAVDSIVDIVAAAVLIARLDASHWTSAPLPLGGGRVRTAHGLLPVPAPATALLLRGLSTIDDGITGERVTPTGAAVARYLLADAPASNPQPRRLRSTGIGFGTRTLPGISNCLRVLAFVEELGATATSAFAHRELGVITFEVDDQSAEDLGHGLDHLRALEGVHDVIQSVALGKKGRVASHVQVLVAPARLDAAIAACFAETTTIGLRFHTVQGAALPRRFADVEVDGHALRVKAVTRPDGRLTGKTEAADIAAVPGHAARAALRRSGEAAALARLAAPETPKTAE